MLRQTPNAEFSIVFAPGLYTSEASQAQLREDVVESALLRGTPYRYSDLGFYLMGDLVRELSGLPLDEFVSDNFYIPLGLRRTAFHPTQKFPLSEIVPTENDTILRKQVVHGFVHDETVALLGGVGGSAGLFANANDLAVIMQMLLNGGEYNGRRYISKPTIDLFTQRILPPRNRRGAGFDKPAMGSDGSPAAQSASARSFGHSGFTGTIAWADPANQMVYIFLCNRVHPTAADNKLVQQKIRPELQQMFYDVLR